MIVLNQSPDNNRRGKPHNGNIPSHTELTTQQMGQTLTVISTLLPFLAVPENVSDKVEVEPNAREAASCTFLKACNVLDNILDDQKRWGLGGYDRLEDSILKVHEMQMEALNEQADSMAMASRPCILLKPELKQLEDGTWQAKYGKGPAALTGHGENPNEAMLEFDAIYYDILEQFKKEKKEQQEAEKKEKQ